MDFDSFYQSTAYQPIGSSSSPSIKILPSAEEDADSLPLSNFMKHDIVEIENESDHRLNHSKSMEKLSSDEQLSTKLRRGMDGRWRKFDDSEYGTSEDYDEIDEDSDDAEHDDKENNSDTETRKLLDDDDEEEIDASTIDLIDGVRPYSVYAEPENNKVVVLVDEENFQTSNPFVDETVYCMTDEQKQYYRKCFNHIMMITQSKVDPEGAIFGAHEEVINFFKKSGLDNDKLSKIWTLSDVNEDGYLDFAEFSAAMHIIILHIKGSIDIPNKLPAEIRSPMKTPRNAVIGDIENCEEMERWNEFDLNDSSSAHAYTQLHYLSDDRLCYNPSKSETMERLRFFSDIPPLLVDERPTALRASDASFSIFDSLVQSSVDGVTSFALSPQGPRGPPPKPPPRPANNKGHARSASLDLKISDEMQRFPLYSPFSSTSKGGTLPAQTIPHLSQSPFNHCKAVWPHLSDDSNNCLPTTAWNLNLSQKNAHLISVSTQTELSLVSKPGSSVFDVAAIDSRANQIIRLNDAIWHLDAVAFKEKCMELHKKCLIAENYNY